MDTFDTIKEEYLNYVLIERGYSVHTLHSYDHDLTLYVSFLRSHDIDDPAYITREIIEAYIAHLFHEGMSSSTVQRAVSSIKGFHKFMVVEQICENHPTTNLKLPKKSFHLPDVLTQDQIIHLLDDPFKPQLLPAPKLTARKTLSLKPQACFYRDKAILEMLYGCGLRVSELCGLNQEDVLVSDELVRVFGKGSKERLVPCLGTALESYQNYCTKWRALLACGAQTTDAVFLSVRGTRISRQAVFSLVERYGSYVGIKGLHPHTLRHSYATHMLEGGMNLRIVQELLGHASISTTQLYTHIDLTHIRSEYMAAHPRAQIK